MVNFGFGTASILGIFLAVAGAGLYFLRSVRPELARDHDIFFAAVGLLCGFILLFQGWRLDPILQFGQLLLTGSTIFFAVESIRLRSVATEQAKRNTRIVDEDRPVSTMYEYQAELDDYEPIEEERTIPRRIKGTRDIRSTRTDDYEDETSRRYYRRDEESSPPRRSNSRSTSVERLEQGDRPRQRRPRPDNSRTSRRVEADEWGYPQQGAEEDWDASNTEVRKPSRPTSTSGSSRRDREPDLTSKPRKRRPSSQASLYRRDDVEPTSTDYVDYKPVESFDQEQDNSANFDER